MDDQTMKMTRAVGLQGGSAFSQLGLVLKHPNAISRVIGTALPNSSNFFVTYVIIQVGLSGPHCP
jgi:hypothetical protein